MIWSKTLLKEEKLKNKDVFGWENQRIIGQKNIEIQA